MSTTHINRLRCSITNTPGLAGNVVVGAATSAARRTFTATEDGKSFEPTFEDGNAWETRTGCVYTHSTTTLTRGTLVDSSTGSAIALTSSAVVTLGSTAKQMQDLEAVRPTSASWSLTWDTTGSKDFGTYTATSALSFVSNDVGSVIGGSSVAAVIPAGYSATFDGLTNSGWVSSGSSPNVVSLYRIGTYKFWSVNGITTAIVASIPAAPTWPSAPIVVSAFIGAATSFSGSPAGYPVPVLSYQWQLDGSNISGATSATYTPLTGDVGHSLRVVVTATNASGSLASTSNAVTVTASVRFTSLSNVTESGSSAAWLYTSSGTVLTALAGAPSVYRHAGIDASVTVAIPSTNLHLLGFDSTSSASTFQNWDCGIYPDSVLGKYLVLINSSSGGVAGNGAATLTVPAAGDKMRLSVASNTVTAQVSKDSGVTWLTIHTFATTFSSALYPMLTPAPSETIGPVTSVGMT